MPDAIPSGLVPVLEDAVRHALGTSFRIVDAHAVAGGDINRAARIVLDGSADLFLKWNASAPPGMFEAEADGLAALGAAAGEHLVVPAVVTASGSSADGPAWLLMEFLESRHGGRGFGERLGHAVAHLHLRSAADEGRAWGWARDNFIGSLSQSNRNHPTWPAFWRAERIGPQLDRARGQGWFTGADGRVLDRLMDRLDDLLADAASDGPSLLHGDLWGGNVMDGADGRPALVDPAVFRGDPEVDLAMSRLFGFPAGFLDAYREVRAVDEAFEHHRVHLYQLYYLLVHVNLFGGGYVAGCVRAAEAALRGV